MVGDRARNIPWDLVVQGHNEERCQASREEFPDPWSQRCAINVEMRAVASGPVLSRRLFTRTASHLNLVHGPSAIRRHTLRYAYVIVVCILLFP